MIKSDGQTNTRFLFCLQSFYFFFHPYFPTFNGISSLQYIFVVAYIYFVTLLWNIVSRKKKQQNENISQLKLKRYSPFLSIPTIPVFAFIFFLFLLLLLLLLPQLLCLLLFHIHHKFMALFVFAYTLNKPTN